MKVGIDARMFGPRAGGGGLGRYVEELIRHLEKMDRENEYIIFLRRENWNDYAPSAPNFKKILAPWRWYTLSEQIFMPRAIAEARVDLMHFPHFNVPAAGRAPFAVTIHDLNLLEYPKTGITTLDPIRFWLKFLAYRLVLRHAIKSSRKIIAVSESTRRAILKNFKIPPQKITVIPPGFGIQKKKSAPSAIYRKPYLLTVGNSYPHKNLKGLLQAFQKIKDGNELTVVMAGPDDRFRERLKKHAERLGIADRVIFHGFAKDEELETLYGNALALVMPSFLEGFGFPILEAEARQVPVLASDIPALRETAGDSALFFNPARPEDIANAIQKIAADKGLRQRLIDKGTENLKRFSSADTAGRTLAIYRISAKI